MLATYLARRLLGPLIGFFQLQLALLERSDVGKVRDRAAAGDLPLGDQSMNDGSLARSTPLPTAWPSMASTTSTRSARAAKIAQRDHSEETP
jgi:hypothetical protein